jgi:hypothetical protein
MSSSLLAVLVLLSAIVLWRWIEARPAVIEALHIRKRH